MDRRRAIKLLAGIGLAGALFFWFYRKLGFGVRFDVAELMKHKPTIDQLAETIIPETDTPGAIRAQVGDYIVRIVSDCCTPKEQAGFVKGLSSLDDYCRRKYGQTFVQCKGADRIAVLEHMERKATSRFGIVNKVISRLFGTPFIVQLKALTTQGYCTSEFGATMALAYDPIPVHYQGCIPLKPGQKTWAL